MSNYSISIFVKLIFCQGIVDDILHISLNGSILDVATHFFLEFFSLYAIDTIDDVLSGGRSHSPSSLLYTDW